MNNLSVGVSLNKENRIAVETKIIVSVVIPIRNEEKHIVNCLESVIGQDYPKENLEIILVDGMSEDRTIEIINTYKDKHPFIYLYHNPNKTVPYAMNIGIKNAQGEYIVRLDAHAQYAIDYISKCIEYLEKTDASNVGGPMIAVGVSSMQKAIAASYHSPFAMGGGKFHKEGYEGYADTVWLGAYKKSALISIGMYDETFSRSEDDELNYRMTNSGKKTYISPEIKCKYYPRTRLDILFKQYFEYGLWKPAVIKKHKKPSRLSHLVPTSFVLFILLFGIGSFFSSLVANTFLTVLLIYILLDVYFSFSSKYAQNFKIKLLLCLVHIVLHISYGLGFLKGIVKFILSTKIEYTN